VTTRTSGSALNNGRELGDLDRKLIEILQVDGRTPFRRIARTLGVSEKVVRKRVAQLRDDMTVEIAPVAAPYLHGYTGLASIAARVSTTESAMKVGAAVADLALIDHVAVVAGRFDLFAEAICRDREELVRFVDDEMRHVPGLDSLQIFPYLELSYYQALGLGAGDHSPNDGGYQLGDIDAKIIEELHVDGRVPLRSIARNLGVSEAHVRHRMNVMTQSGMLRVMAITNPTSVGLTAGAWLGVRLAPTTPSPSVAKRLADVPSVTYVTLCVGGFDMFAEVLCSDHSELTSILDQELRVIPGIQSIESFSHLGLHIKRPRYSLGT
jgi:Lrp/AsnC family transcriptional regulator, regulator for asnA, asnC and gidA